MRQILGGFSLVSFQFIARRVRASSKAGRIALLTWLQARIPTVTIFGQFDPYISIKYHERIAQAGATKIDVRGGHWLALSHANVISRAIKSVLSHNV